MAAFCDRALVLVAEGRMLLQLCARRQANLPSLQALKDVLSR
jgi:hypothetical protein